MANGVVVVGAGERIRKRIEIGFFFSSRRRHTRLRRDWSSDVCSSDLQGPSKEILLGTIIRYRIQESSHFTGYFAEQAIAIGGHYRWKDAFIPSVWYEVSNFAIGISYDMNVSSLRTASNLRGGMEISLRFMNPNPFTYKRWSEPSFN
mgnify:CR=1 FL=1